MSLHSHPIDPVPAPTARVAHAAFPKGSLAIRIRDELGVIYHDEQFAPLFPTRGQAAVAPWRLMLVTRFAEALTDRQAADAVRGCPFKRGYVDRFERSWRAKPGAFLNAPIGSDSRQLTVPPLPDSGRLTRSSSTHPQSPAKGCAMAWWPLTFTGHPTAWPPEGEADRPDGSLPRGCRCR
jgi:hypothetical protein